MSIAMRMPSLARPLRRPVEVVTDTQPRRRSRWRKLGWTGTGALVFLGLLVLLALIVTSWPWYARTYRALLLKERSALYVESAIAAGASRWRVLLQHVLPNNIG